MTNQNKAMALTVAVAVLEGTAGGYSPQEKEQAKACLIEMQKQSMAAALAEMENQ